ncbi:hypothetical protein WJX73_010140 [Symbiochloris irregularis]|uniref:C-terminal processing peptidase n=1 Tax=Symbiochloris irregularis TaxID=706552 RepID=A0AAW1PRR6_9CHLO
MLTGQYPHSASAPPWSPPTAGRAQYRPQRNSAIASTSGRVDLHEAISSLLRPVRQGCVHHWQQVSCSVAASALAVAFVVAQPVAAITNEQLIFLEAWRAIDRAYVDKSFNGQSWFRLRERTLKNEPLSSREETYAAIRKAIAVLNDPFTRFLEPARYQALTKVNSGQAVIGVGLEVGADQNTGSLTVIAPSAGGPAERAGIRPLDKLLTIGDKSTQGMSLYEAGDLLQGAEGSEVTLTIQPHNSAKGDPAKTVANFSKTTTDSVREALKGLKQEGADRYVLDIRNNGGGFFPSGVEVARMWMNSGDIVLIADSKGVRDTYDANGTAQEPKAPLALLVNKGTASASEVLAGALQDSGRASVVGETTYGKGLIQTIVGLSDGSAVVITVARYQTPAGVDINNKGITPDVKLAPAAMPPMDGPGFCRYAAEADTPAFFK